MKTSHLFTKVVGVASILCGGSAAALPASPSVTAVISGGDLVITGTEGVDRIVVTQTGPDTWRVSGVGKTKVNGVASVDLDPVTGSIRIDLLGGNDGLLIHDGTVPGGLCVRMGDGNDNAALTNLIIGGGSVLQGDSIATEGFSSGNLVLKGDAGNDTLYVNNVQVLGIQPEATQVASVMDATTQGSESGGSSCASLIAGCDGKDQIIIQNFNIPNLEVTGGAGKDAISLQFGVSQWLCVKAGDDTDKVNVNGIFTNMLKVDVGSSAKDVVSVSGCVANCARFKDCGTKGTIDGAVNQFNNWSVDEAFYHNTLSVYSPQP